MLTVAGVSPSLDLTYVVPSLRLGEIQRTSHVVRCAGGKSLNLARAASTLGASVCVVAILGGLTGAELAASVTAAGIELVPVGTPYETRCCVSIAATDTGKLTEVYQNAAPVPEAVWAGFLQELASVLDQRSGWLVISGGTPPGLDGAALAGVLDLAQRAGFRVAVDTYGPALAASVKLRPDVVKVNRVEAAALLEAPPDANLLEMARELQNRSTHLVVLTDGVQGSVLVDDAQLIRAEPLDSVGRFAVGSGDSFLAGLVTELDRGADHQTALRTAVAAGAANAMEPGPGNVTLSELRRLRGLVRLTAVGA